MDCNSMNSRSFISTLDLKNFLRKTFFNYHTFVIPVHTRLKYRRKITKREASFHFMAFKCKISITSSNIAFEQNWKNKNNLTQTIRQKKKKLPKRRRIYSTEQKYEHSCKLKRRKKKKGGRKKHVSKEMLIECKETVWKLTEKWQSWISLNGKPPRDAW